MRRERNIASMMDRERQSSQPIDCSLAAGSAPLCVLRPQVGRRNARLQSTLILGGFLLSLIVATVDAFALLQSAQPRPALSRFNPPSCKETESLKPAGVYLSLEVGSGGDGGDGPNGSNNNNGGGNGRGRGRRDDNSDDDNKDDGKAPGGFNNNRSILHRLQRWAQSADGREDIFTYGISVVLAILVRMFVLEPRYIPSLSMYPTFDVGDQLFVEKISHAWFRRPIQRGDVVVFSPPKALLDILLKEYGNSEEIKPKEALIKRVVAVEGDKAQVKRDGMLYVNGEVQKDGFTNEDRANYRYGPITVPKDNVLVLGDNRNESLDGHIWGCLPTDKVIGRAICVYWPPWRAGRKDK